MSPFCRAHFTARFIVFWRKNEHEISLNGGFYHWRAKFLQADVLSYGWTDELDADGKSGNFLRYPVNQQVYRTLSDWLYMRWPTDRLESFSSWIVKGMLESLMPYEQEALLRILKEYYGRDF